MKKLGYFILLAFFCLIPEIGSAATHYIRAGAAGSNTGSDWTNAWTSLPSTLTRGDTYYVADGSYGSYTFDDAHSGSTWVYIKKATTSDHGTSTGWLDSYGDGTAVFSSTLKFLTGYYELDGQTGGGPNSWTSGFGFKIQYTGSSNLTKIVVVGDSSHSNIPYLTFKHVEMVYTNPTSTATGQDVFYAIYGGNNWTFQNCYMHHASRVILYTTNVSNITIDKCRLEKNGVNPSSSQHSEIWAARDTHNVVIRHSQILEYRSTGGIIMGRANNWEIYGNVFKWNTDMGSTSNNGAIGSWSSDSTYYATNIKIYNNTFVDLKSGGSGKLFPIYKSASNISAYNNLWYNSPSANFGGVVKHDYNWFKNSNEGSISESHMQTGTGDPFISYSGENYRLNSSTSSGMSLSSPYNADMDGNTRGGDSVWDRGAYEYKSGAAYLVPSSPSSLMVN